MPKHYGQSGEGGPVFGHEAFRYLPPPHNHFPSFLKKNSWFGGVGGAATINARYLTESFIFFEKGPPTTAKEHNLWFSVRAVCGEGFFLGGGGYEEVLGAHRDIPLRQQTALRSVEPHPACIKRSISPSGEKMKPATD